VQVVGFFDVAAMSHLSARDRPIAASVNGSSCSIDSALPHRTFRKYNLDCQKQTTKKENTTIT